METLYTRIEIEYFQLLKVIHLPEVGTRTFSSDTLFTLKQDNKKTIIQRCCLRKGYIKSYKTLYSNPLIRSQTSKVHASFGIHSAKTEVMH